MRNTLIALFLGLAILNFYRAATAQGSGTPAQIIHECPHDEVHSDETIVGAGSRCSSSYGASMTQRNKDKTRERATADAKSITIDAHGCAPSCPDETPCTREDPEFAKTDSEGVDEQEESDCEFTMGAWGADGCSSDERRNYATCTANFDWRVKCACD